MLHVCRRCLVCALLDTGVDGEVATAWCEANLAASAFARRSPRPPPRFTPDVCQCSDGARVVRPHGFEGRGLLPSLATCVSGLCDAFCQVSFDPHKATRTGEASHPGPAALNGLPESAARFLDPSVGFRPRFPFLTCVGGCRLLLMPESSVAVCCKGDAIVTRSRQWKLYCGLPCYL